MAKPTVTVSLNADDLDFVTHSISLNVHCEDEMSDTERRAARKLQRAQDRLNNKCPTQTR